MLNYPIEKYLQDIYDEENGGFRFCWNGETTLLSSCFGVQTCYLTNYFGGFDFGKIAEEIKRQQLTDGIFYDQQLSPKDLTGRQSDEYLQWQFTFFALTALDMLGERSSVELTFLVPFASEKYVVQWLENQDFDDFWYTSNLIMFLLFFLAFEKKNSASARYDNSIETIFSFLRNTQDSQTGFWGNVVRSNQENGLYGAAHIYLFYEYFGANLEYQDKIVETTLNLQLVNGLYGNWEGGACEDYDGVEVLVRVQPYLDSQNEAIHGSLMRTYNMLLKNQDSSGGFSYRIRSNRPQVLVRRLIDTCLKRNIYSFSGWTKMTTDYHKPDIWATYFRLLTIAHIERFLGLTQSYDYSSYSLPAWGYLCNYQE